MRKLIDFALEIVNSPRQCFGLIALGCLSMMIIALIMQYAMDMAPCPLCITQRIFVIGVGLVGFFAWLIKPSSTLGVRTFAVVGGCLAFVGGLVSARHVWIQGLPAEEAPGCGPGLGYMFETRPLFDALSLLFKGDGHCADVNWELLGLSIPGWTLVCFVGLLLFQAWIFFKAKQH